MACYQFKGIKPVIHESSFIHPLSAVTGNVIIGKNVYIGPGAAIRGDFFVEGSPIGATHRRADSSQCGS